MTEKESRYAVVRWLQELCQADAIPTAKKSEIKEAIAKLSDLFGVDITSYDDAINMDYTTLQMQEIMTAAKDALKAGHFDEDEIHANEDRRYGPFYDVIKSKQVICWTFFIFVDFLMIFILSSSHSLYEITHTVWFWIILICFAVFQGARRKCGMLGKERTHTSSIQKYLLPSRGEASNHARGGPYLEIFN